MNNTFSFLPEGTDDSEIKNDNELRNKKKKLKKKIQKNQDNPSDDLSKEIKDLEIEIREYEDSQKTHIPKEKKKKVKEKNSDSDDFLNQEYEKNKARNQKKYKEQEEKERNEKKKREEQRKEQFKKREEQRQEQQKQREREYFEQQKRRKGQQRRRYNDFDSISKTKIFQDCGIKDIPSDLSQLYDNYDKKMYRELTLKYHPDKSNYPDEYFKALNSIKQKYTPNTCNYDESWQK